MFKISHMPFKEFQRNIFMLFQFSQTGQKLYFKTIKIHLSKRRAYIHGSRHLLFWKKIVNYNLFLKKLNIKKETVSAFAPSHPNSSNYRQWKAVQRCTPKLLSRCVRACAENKNEKNLMPKTRKTQKMVGFSRN